MHPRQHAVGLGSPADLALAYGSGAVNGAVNTATTPSSLARVASDPVGSVNVVVDGAQTTVSDISQLFGKTASVGALLQSIHLDPAAIVQQGEAVGARIVGEVGADAKNYWDQQTTTAANDARKYQGVVAAIDIATHGLDLKDPNGSMNKVFGAIAGAAACIPGGVVVSAAIGILLAGFNAMGALFQAIGWVAAKSCVHTGTWTFKEIYWIYTNSVPGTLPPMPPGSFAAMVVPMLAANAAAGGNCNDNSPVPYMDPIKVVAAAAALWNANSSGPPMTVYVPALGEWVFPFTAWQQLPAAFQPFPPGTPLNALGLNPPDAGTWSPRPGVGQAWSTTAPFFLELTGSVLVDPRAQTSGVSPTAKKVLIASAAIPVGVVAGAGVYAVATKTALPVVLKSMWRFVKFW
jgi:hypothetical protein